MDENFFQLAEEFENTKTFDDILQILKRELHLLDFRQFIYLLQINKRYVNPPVICFTNFSQDWFAHYLNNRYYEIDPIIDHALKENLPALWSTENDWDATHGKNTAYFMDDLRNFFGATHGVCLPIVSGDISTSGFLNLVLHECTKPQFEQLASANLIIRYAHQNTLRIWKETASIVNSNLTPREAETLVLACDGLTSEAVAKELNISKRTVDTHFNSAIVKLGVKNRQQALTKAVSLGLIKPRAAFGEDLPEAMTLVI